MTKMKWIGAMMVMAAALAFGCQKKDGGENGSSDTTETSASGDGHDHEGHDHSHGDEDGDHSHDSEGAASEGESAADKVAANLAKLSEADRAVAEQQKVCPVSDEPLGSMGVPIKVTVKDGDKDKEVFVCCGGCVKPVKEDPAKYLAKLKQ